MGTWNWSNSYLHLPNFFWSKVNPSPVTSPKLCVLNTALARELQLNEQELMAHGTEWFSGNGVPPGAEPIAQAYSGHQFAHFVRLGDGRAILLGEHLSPTNTRYDIQLKGSGKTPYSRRGDGRAAIGPMLREHLIGEFLFAVGIPTTRALAVVSTGEAVYRETPLPGAVLTRVARSHIRVGTFEHAASFGTKEDLAALVRYTHHRLFGSIDTSTAEQAKRILEQTVLGQAQLIAQWMHVGFVHGVMNTDNMSISCESLDFGPCAFLDNFDPEAVWSSIDHHGRYSYKNQPSIGLWNLSRLANALVPLLHESKEHAIAIAQECLNNYEPAFQNAWTTKAKAKLGLNELEETQSIRLMEDFYTWLGKSKFDHTNAFAVLSSTPESEELASKDSVFFGWWNGWKNSIENSAKPLHLVQEQLKTINPQVIPRNHVVQAALDEATMTGSLERYQGLVRELSNPFAPRPAEHSLRQPPKPDEKVCATFCGT